jgi:hypothetical protein
MDVRDLKISFNQLGKAPKLALIAAVAGLLATVAGFFLSGNEHGLFFRAYLVGFMFWFNMAAGCLFWLMVQHLSGGAWGVMIRRVVEAGAKMLPGTMLFFLPIFFLGMGSIYEWTDLDLVKHDNVLLQKSAWLNTTSFTVRFVIYAIVWGLLAFGLSSISSRQDRGINPRLTLKMKNISGPGMVLLFLTMTFAAVDWLLSLEPHFFSTMYGPVVMAGQALGSMAFIVAVMVILVNAGPMRERLTSGHVHDMGNFLLASTMFWAYVNFSQFLIIWSGNVAEEVPYYLRRMSGGWGVIGSFLIAFHFFAPFFLLLNRKLKKNIFVLVKLAYFILFLRFVDLCYLILPSAIDHHAADANYQGHMYIGSILVAAVAVIGIGGVWLFFFFRSLAQRPLLPINDPYLKEALEFRGGH